MTAAKALPASTRAHFASSSPRPLAGQAATCQLAGVDVRLVAPSEGQGERVAEPNLLFSPEFLREGRAPPRQPPPFTHHRQGEVKAHRNPALPPILPICIVCPLLSNGNFCRPMKPSEQVHFRILRAIESNPEITQRELSALLGVSKGKTNYLIAALIEKGLIKIGNFQREKGKLGKIAYLLTAAGIKNRAALTRDYLARKEAEYKALKAEIQALRKIEDNLPVDVGSVGGGV